MSLRRKLIFMHATFMAFAVAAAAATVYGVQLHVRNTVNALDQLVDESNRVDRLRVDAQQQFVWLHEIASGRGEINDSYLARSDAFFTRLEEAGHFAAQGRDDSDWRHIVGLGQSLRATSQRCLDLVRASRNEEALRLLTTRIERDLMVALNTRLDDVKKFLDDARRRSLERVEATNVQLYGLAALIALTCLGFLIVATAMVRRWLIEPITDLQTATQEFGKGRLDHRVALSADDEFGALGQALNEMASSLGATQRKYRSLFENLRDAVIILDPDGHVVECRDSDTRVLGIAPERTLGRRLLDIWPEWSSAAVDWNDVVSRVARGGRHFRALDVALPPRGDQRAIVDVIAYPIEYAEARYVAIVLRDATERDQLQRLGRRSETMEAAVTLAQGIAHDFKNLLNSAVTTLSLIADQGGDSKDAARIQTALRACRQAAGLSRRLLGFATADEGNPEMLSLGEMVRLILGSLDEPFLAPLDVRVECDRPVRVRMDKDQLTQIILNLIHNAADAMPDGGRLSITIGEAVTANPIGRRPPSPHAVLAVSDTGCGMTPEVKQRLFEPLFTTKGRGRHGRRGMGLAVVYAAVRNADGFIQVDSEVGRGTTIRIHLPSVEAHARFDSDHEAAQQANP
ncbi:MAG: ATP-binding protein, partial [Phycisphaerae bacterium]